MKWKLTLLMVCLTVFGYGQNYQPINSNSLQVFYQEELFSEAEPYNMWGTRIDSVTVVNGDSIYFNYPIYRDTVGIPLGAPRCVWVNAPNWNGAMSRITQDEICWFYNQAGDSIRIQFGASIGHTWSAYQFPNGDSLIGEILNISLVDDSWAVDSVKTIGFSRQSGGNVISDPTNNLVLELFKTQGFRQVIDFVNFPHVLEPILRVDPNTINATAPGYRANGKIVGAPQIGNGYSYSDVCQTHYGPCKDAFYESVIITNVQPDGNGNLLVTRTRNHRTLQIGQISGHNCSFDIPPVSISSPLYSTEETLLYEVIGDGFSEIFRSGDGTIGLMPRENKAAYQYILNLDSTDCENPIVYVDGCWWPYEEEISQEDSCVQVYFRTTAATFPCTYSVSRSYSPTYGFLDSRTWDYDDYDGSYRTCTKSYSYFSGGDGSCGEYRMLDIGENIQASGTFSLFPNPATNSIKLQLSNAKTPLAATVSITDVLGRTISNLALENSNLELNVSDWPNGIYFLSLSDRNGNRHTERLVVQH